MGNVSMTIKASALAIFAAALLPTGAMAADVNVPKLVPVKAAPVGYVVDWSGLDVSAYGLYGANFTDTTLSVGTAVADLASSPHGPGLGGSLGYNVQLAPNGVVVGLRGDIAYANLSGSGQINTAALSVSNATNYLGDLDVVLGLPLTADGRLLAYGVGGFAFGGAKPNLHVASLSQAASDTSTGWNVGAGLSYKLDPHWRLFMEGDYYQLGDKSLTASDPITGAPIATSTAHYKIAVQKLGIGFTF